MYHVLGAGTGIGIDPHVLFTRDGSGSWGGYLGGLVGMWAYLRLTRASTLPYLDIAPVAALLAPAIGRWGCLFAGCDFGRVTSVPWAIHYPQGSPAYQTHMAISELPFDATQSLGVHPLPIYLSLNALFLFLVLTAIWRRTEHRPGITLAAAWILYGSSRFFWEFLRDPAAGGASSGLSLPQWMAVAAICVGGVIGVIAARGWRMATARPCAADA
jgi:phosphatidylglycerol:prolipoprotein diacylglycerol transferase